MTKSNCNLCKYLCIIPGLAVYRLRDVFNLQGAGSSLLTVGIICVISNKAVLLDFSDSNNNTEALLTFQRWHHTWHGDRVIGGHWPGPLTADYWHVLSLWTRGAPGTRVCNPVSDCCVRLASTWHHIIVTLTSSWHLLVVIRHRHCCFHYRHWAQSWVVNDGFNSEAGQRISWFLNSRIYVRCM